MALSSLDLPVGIKARRPPMRVVGTDWQSIMTALRSAPWCAFWCAKSRKRSIRPSVFPLAEVVVNGWPGRKAARQHTPMTSHFDQVELSVQDVSPAVVAPMVSCVEKCLDLLPLGVRQTGAIVFAHSFGSVFGEKGTHHRKRGGLPFVYVKKFRIHYILPTAFLRSPR